MVRKNSSVSRILSASAANWFRIGITIVSQVALVPIYLSKWDSETYGAWLLLGAVWGLFTFLNSGLFDYFGNECLRLGADKHNEIAQLMSSAVFIGFLLSGLDFLLVWVFLNFGLATDWITIDTEMYQQWTNALLLKAGTYAFTIGVSGTATRVLAVFGYYPRTAWWGVGYGMLSAFGPGLAVFLGANLWEAAITACLLDAAYHLFYFTDVIRISRRELLLQHKPLFKQGISLILMSLWVSARGLIETFRQQGIRIILAPLAGVSDMAAFATMRTGANFALQGLGTITGPIMPELMRFLNARDQARTESSFAVVWLALCVFLSPAVLVVQYIAPELFPLWTRGKFVFDPWLFGMLSLGVLTFALAQPAMSVLTGNNVLRPQLLISALAASETVGGMFLLVPLMGISGAALALLTAELISMTAYLVVTSRWLQKNGMHWPRRSFLVALISVMVAALGMIAIAMYPEYGLKIMATAILLELLVSMIYWSCLPKIAKQRAAGLLCRLLPGAFRSRFVAVMGGTQ